jgi:parallel beta-helix repeat protein
MRNVLLIIAICVLAIGALFLLGGAGAETIIVDDDWSGADYDTISEAIVNADPGDTIRVYDGTYNECNDVTIPLNLIGNGTTTIIDGYKKDHVFGFNLLAGNTNVSGFYFYRWWPTHHYAGVGIYSNGNRVFDNTFYKNGRGVFLGGCRDNHIYNNTFDDNYYSLLVYEGADKTNVSFNTFSKPYMSSILWGKSHDGVIFSNTFKNYTSRAISVHRSSNFTVSYNMLYVADTTQGSRRGISYHLVDDSSIHNNTLIGHVRSISIAGTSNVTIEHNTIVGDVEGLLFSRTWSGRQQLGKYCNDTVVRYNNVVGQSMFGVNATGNRVASINLSYNWWGAPSGPYHPINNSMGEGAAASDLAIISPWLGKMVDDMPPIAFIDHAKPALANEGEPVELQGRALARNWSTEHLWTSDIDGVLYRGPKTTITLDDLSPGTHTITLRVKDTFGKWSSEVSIKVIINGLPVATIVRIEPPLVNDGEPVTFKGRYLDFENDVRDVVWISDIDGEIGRTTEFTLTNLTNGTHTITFQVRDGHDAWSNLATGEVIVNGRPIAFIDSIEHPLVNEGESVIFRGVSVDAEDGVVDHLWESDIDGVLSDQLTFFTASLSNGTHTISFRVLDDFEVWSRNATATVVVNGLPRAFIDSISPDTITKGETVAFQGRSLDHEGDIIAREWTSDLQGALSDSEAFSTSDLIPGVHMISFRVMDGHEVWSQWALAVVQVFARPSAWIVSDLPAVVNEDETVHLEGGFEDPDTDIRSYLWTSDIDGEIGTARNLTTSVLTNGTHSIKYRVMNDHGIWSPEATLSLTINGLPRGRIVEVVPSSANEGDAIKFVGTYTDHEDEVLLVEWTSDIDGLLGEDLRLSLDGLSNGTHIVSFRVMDGQGIWSEPALVTVDVNGRPRAHIDSIGPEGAMVGRTVFFSGSGEDDLAVVAYRWSSSIDGVLSDISVFSTDDLSPGTHDITFIVQDNEGVWSEASVLTFVVEGFDTRVEITSIEMPRTAFEGEELVLGCTLANPGNVPLIGMSVRFSIAEATIGTVEIDEPLHPGSQLPVETTWSAQLGRHVVLVEVFHKEILLRSGLSEGTLSVEEVGDPDGHDDVPTETPMPEETGRISDGIDKAGSPLLIVVIAIAIAVFYMDRVRRRPPRWEDDDPSVVS